MGCMDLTCYDFYMVVSFMAALLTIHLLSLYFQKFIEHSDANKSGDVCLKEFIEYVREHEKHLRLSFTHIDKNKDGLFFFPT